MGVSLEWAARTRRQEDRFPLCGAACVIEPNDDLRAEIAVALRNMGYITHETGTGTIGAFIAEQVHLRVVLVNLALADVKALTLIRRIRAANPDAAIVALTPPMRTGLGDALAAAAGADTTLSQPASSEALSAALSCAARHPRVYQAAL